MGTLDRCNLLKVKRRRLNICKEKIAKYKRIRHIVQDGNSIDRKLSRYDYHIFEYVNKDELYICILATI